MRRAIAQAREVPLLPFGPVLVRGATGEVLAEGHNRSAASPTFHGEIDVINRLAAGRPQVDWGSLVLYTTAEPCPMCQSAVEWAGIPWVAYGPSIPFLQGLGWWQIDIRAVEVTPLFSLRENVIAQEPGLSYPAPWRCASRLGASLVAQTPSSLPRR
jgi:tRNA(Arg) A34 adenosine deaminase TadA